MSKKFSKILIKKSNKKTIPNFVLGFTLIELLIVISLMGLLSFIVLASLDNARAKGRDSQVRLQEASLRAQAERYYSANGVYYKSEDDNVCVSTPNNLGFSGKPFDSNGLVENPSGLLKDVQDTVYLSSKLYVKMGSPGAWNQITCHASPNNWVVDIPNSNSKIEQASMYCIDSTGTNYRTKAITSNHIDCYETPLNP